MSYKIANNVAVVYCPIFKKDIDMGLCCDICHCAFGCIKKDFCPEITDWNLAKSFCDKCENAF